MSKLYLIGIDVGVSLTKIGVYDEGCRLISSESQNNPSTAPEPGLFLQSAEKLFEIVIGTLKKLVAKTKIDVNKVQAICFSAAMGGAMGVDENWKEIANWSIVSDTRFYPYVASMLDEGSEEILKISGTNFPVFAPKVMWRAKEFPEIHKKVKKYVFLNGFIIGRMGNLSIEDAIVDKTHLSFTGIADIQNSRWSKSLLGKHGIDESILPRIVGSDEIVGRLDKNIAHSCGLPSGIPLIAGSGDKPAGTVGAGMNRTGMLLDESATFGALSYSTDKYIPDIKNKTLENLRSPLNDLYLPSVFINGAGATQEWFMDVFGYEEKIRSRDTGKTAFKVLEDEAEGVSPGSNGLLAIGLLGGRGYPYDPKIKGMWLGHSWYHKKKHFFRALLESHAYEYATVLRIIKRNYTDFSAESIKVIGGGARSDLYNQIKCDVMGISYLRLNRDDYTLLGDIIIAGKAVGIFEDLDEVYSSISETKKEYSVIEKNYKIYEEILPIYIRSFHETRNIFTNLNKFTSKSSLE